MNPSKAFADFLRKREEASQNLHDTAAKLAKHPGIEKLLDGMTPSDTPLEFRCYTLVTMVMLAGPISAALFKGEDCTPFREELVDRLQSPDRPEEARQVAGAMVEASIRLGTAMAAVCAVYEAQDNG